MPSNSSGQFSLADTLRRSWQRKAWLSGLLMPLASLYGATVAARRWIYQRGLLRAESLPAYVMVVGNVVAGGAGKTPVTIALVHALLGMGLQVGVISRGYGRKSTECLEVATHATAEEVGDEPLLIWYKTQVPVFVAGRRLDAGRALLAQFPQTQVIICDDGLQHLALHRDLEICVFNEAGVQNGRLLPAGPLREKWPRNVDAVLYRGAVPAALPLQTPAWLMTRFLADKALNIVGQSISLIGLASLQKVAPEFRVIAVAGTANPQSFFSMLEQGGLFLHETHALPDHADFAALPAVLRKPLPEGVVVLCTEKDAVKLWNRVPTAYAVPLVVELPDAFLDFVAQRLKTARIL